VGVYTAVITASNGIAPDATHTFTLTVVPSMWNINLGSSTGGRISANATNAEAGRTVTVTVTPNRDYELDNLSVTRDDNNEYLSINHYQSTGLVTFTMPASDVTVTANFLKTDLHSRWERAKALIEAAVFTLPQDKAINADLIRYALADLINQLIASTGFTISPYDIVVFLFNTATAGDPDNPSGVGGRFEFRVSPAVLNNSAYSSGVITATQHDPTTANGELNIENGELKAWIQNGVLHVSGLKAGDTWSLYNLSGILLHRVAATDSKAQFPLPELGLYLIVSGGKTVKVIY
jgi:hypothetical protein